MGFKIDKNVNDFPIDRQLGQTLHTAQSQKLK